MIEIEEKMMGAIEAVVKRLDVGLPYHNYQHSVDVRNTGRSLVADCEARNIGPINEVVVDLAGLFHDAGYDEDHTKKGFPTKEKYSAYLAQEILSKQFQLEQEVIDQVVAAIIATEKDAVPVTLEEKIVRHADLVALGAPYEVFVSNTIKLKREAEMRSGKKISWLEWKKSTSSLIASYPLHLDGILTDEEAKQYKKRLGENLERLVLEDEQYLQTLYEKEFGIGTE